MIKGPNIWGYFLRKIKVPYTQSYIVRLYKEIFDHGNLYGFSKMLEIYNVDYLCLSANEETLLELEMPAVTSINNHIIVIDHIDISNKRITLTDANLIKKIMSLDDFLKIWDQIVLTVEPDSEKSGEPSYTNNRNIEWGNRFMYGSFVVLVIVLAILYIDSKHLIFRLISVIVNLLGAFFSVQLILKELNIKVKLTDKICSLLEKNTCKDVINYKESFFLQWIDLGAVGVSYFLFNVIILMFCPNFQLYFLFGFLSVFFTFWSIGFQKFKIKKWCTLCLLVQLVLWIIFIINLLYIYNHPFRMVYDHNMLLFCGIGLALFLIANMIITHFHDRIDYHHLKKENNYFKSNRAIIQAIFQGEKHDLIGSSLTIGENDAQVKIVFFLSLHCGYCKKINDTVFNFFENREIPINISYLFHIQPGEDDIIGIFIHYAKQHPHSISIAKIIKDWYRLENKERFLEKYKEYNVTNQEVSEEIALYKSWAIRKQLNKTPYIYVNQRFINPRFSLEDIFIYHDLFIE